MHIYTLSRLIDQFSDELNAIVDKFEDYYEDIVYYFANKSSLPDDIVLVEWDKSKHSSSGYFRSHRNITDTEIVFSPSMNKHWIIGVNHRYGKYNDRITIVVQRYYPNCDRPSRDVYANLAPLKYTHYKNSPDNSCQITALTNLLDQGSQDTYDLILGLMRMGGWSPDKTGNLTTKNRWKDVFECFGRSYECVWGKYRSSVRNLNGTGHISGMTVSTAAKKFPTGTYICDVYGHVCCIIDGVVHDHQDPRTQKIKNLYRVN